MQGVFFVVHLGFVLRIGDPVGGLAGGFGVHAVEGVVAGDVEVWGLEARSFIHGRVVFHDRKNFACEGVDLDGFFGGAGDGDPLGEQGDAVVQLVVDGDVDAFESCIGGWGGELEGQRDAGRRPGRSVAPWRRFQGKRSSSLAGFEGGEGKRSGVGGESFDPLGFEVGVIGLAAEAADVELLAVDFEDSFGFDAADDGLAGDEVVEADGGGVGGELDGAADQAVVELDGVGFGVVGDGGGAGGGVDEPVVNGGGGGGQGNEDSDENEKWENSCHGEDCTCTDSHTHLGELSGFRIFLEDAAKLPAA